MRATPYGFVRWRSARDVYLQKGFANRVTGRKTARKNYMYAIIKTGGKQYRVAEGDFLKVETLNADVEGEVVFNEVLAVSTEEGLKVGTPVVEGAAVTAVVTHHGRADKVRIFKFRRRKHSMKSAGHRQNYTEVKIVKIQA